ncbi:DUF4113 domain-containing protein [Pseudomonas aeruginosa]|nr:DUF4113 domain-containing protein [Pseudomonas aeruginosa]
MVRCYANRRSSRMQMGGQVHAITERTASVPVSPEWGMRRELKSPSYTTRLDELRTVGSGSS